MSGRLSLSSLAEHISRYCKYALVVCTVTYSLLGTTTVFAGILQGVVVDTKGDPQPRIRINFTGPAQRVVITDGKGQYRISAPGGSYRARISNKQRRQDQNVSIPSNGVKNLNFKVKW